MQQRGSEVPAWVQEVQAQSANSPQVSQHTLGRGSMCATRRSSAEMPATRGFPHTEPVELTEVETLQACAALWCRRAHRLPGCLKSAVRQLGPRCLSAGLQAPAAEAAWRAAAGSETGGRMWASAACRQGRVASMSGLVAWQRHRNAGQVSPAAGHAVTSTHLCQERGNQLCLGRGEGRLLQCSAQGQTLDAREGNFRLSRLLARFTHRKARWRPHLKRAETSQRAPKRCCQADAVLKRRPASVQRLACQRPGGPSRPENC